MADFRFMAESRYRSSSDVLTVFLRNEIAWMLSFRYRAVRA